MGRLFLVQLDGRTYSCKYCHSHLALFEELISKSFHCKNGRAYLFNTVVNVFVGPLEDRMMTTGMHTVADIFCNCCGQIVGWKYVCFTARICLRIFTYYIVLDLSPCNGIVPSTLHAFGALSLARLQEAAHEKSQKYKEGKFILERARMVDGDGRNFLVDTHVGGSDADDI